MKLTNKHKLYLLIFVSLLLFYLANKRSFSKSINLVTAYEQNLQSYQDMLKNAKEINTLKMRAFELDSLIGKGGVSLSEVQQKLLQFAGQNQHKCKIVELKPPYIHTDDNFIVNTNNLVVKGSYNNLAKLIYDFEKDFNLAKLVSINYYKKKNYKTKKTSLFVELIFQNYEKK